MAHVKILATLGPASSTRPVIGGLIDAGASAFRFNFSHGSHAEHRVAVGNARAEAAERQKHITLIQDLQGPKIRVDLEGRDPLRLEQGDEVALTAERGTGDPGAIRVAYPPLCDDVRAGETILFDDGKIVVEVVSMSAPRVMCSVRVGGVLSDRKGMNLPGTRTSLSPLTDKDRADVAAGATMGFDAVALSFVQCAADIELLRAELEKRGRSVPVIAKLERPAAVENLEEILEVADGVMVARGDLGIEINVERVPVIQKRIIAAANRRAVPVITATQMLESMTHAVTPTRAEVTDVANAVYDGTDVVMLSGETSVGQFPRESVSMMGRVIREAEGFPAAYTRGFTGLSSETTDEDGTTSHLVVQATRDMDVRAICLYTRTGRTACLVSKFRPQVPVYAFCHDLEVVRWMNMLWGVTPVPFPAFDETAGLIKAIDDYAVANGIADAGALIALAFGAPDPSKQLSNTLRLHQVGD